jgi:AraC-like DNA-binding protein
MQNKTDHKITEQQGIPCPIERIGGIWRFDRTAGTAPPARSTPGHLMHFIQSGQVKLNVGDRNYIAGPGSIIYYYASEIVKSHFITDTLFYSVAFSSHQFTPLPLGNRLLTANKITMQLVEQLYTAYKSIENSHNSWHCFELLLKLVDEIQCIPQLTAKKEQKKAIIWHKIEAWLKQENIYRPNLEEICNKFKLSRSTVIRSCRTATGTTPMRHLQQIRMNEAKALLTFSGLNVSATATYLDYPRIHEFSREFSKYFGHPPTAMTQH